MFANMILEIGSDKHRARNAMIKSVIRALRAAGFTADVADRDEYDQVVRGAATLDSQFAEVDEFDPDDSSMDLGSLQDEFAQIELASGLDLSDECGGRMKTATNKKDTPKMNFVIDNDNNITALVGKAEATEGQILFASEADLTTVSAHWSTDRLVEIWNSFAGVAPFDDLKPVRKFTDRKTAVARIWKAIQRLAPAGVTTEEEAPAAAEVADNSNVEENDDMTKSRNAKKAKARAARANRPAAAKHRDGSTKKDQVIALLKRAKGATLTELMSEMGWLSHTTRAFVSTLASKGGEKVESFKNPAGERAYRIEK